MRCLLCHASLYVFIHRLWSRWSNGRKDTSDLLLHTSLSFSGGLHRLYIRVHPPLLFGAVGILIPERSWGMWSPYGVVLVGAVSYGRPIGSQHVRESLHRHLFGQRATFSRILHGNRHCIHRVRYQRRSGGACHCVKKQR